MNGAALAAGATVGAGIALVVRGALPPAAPLDELLADLHRPRTAPSRTAPSPTVQPALEDEPGWLARAGRPAAARLTRIGLPRARIREDLALLDRSADVHVAEQAAAGVLGAVLAPLLTGLLLLGGFGVTVAVPVWGCLLLGAAGFWTPDLLVRAQAAARRAEFTHALGAFLDLVVIGLASGAGVEAALTQAARSGHDWAFERLRHAQATAEITRVTPWTALADLGEHLRIPALREIAATLALAGTEGATVRTSLAAKASTLRLRELTSAEASAVAATEQMSLPVIVMFAGFLLFLGFPAVVNVFGAL